MRKWAGFSRAAWAEFTPLSLLLFLLVVLHSSLCQGPSFQHWLFPVVAVNLPNPLQSLESPLMGVQVLAHPSVHALFESFCFPSAIFGVTTALLSQSHCALLSAEKKTKSVQSDVSKCSYLCWYSAQIWQSGSPGFGHEIPHLPLLEMVVHPPLYGLKQWGNWVMTNVAFSEHTCITPQRHL